MRDKQEERSANRGKLIAFEGIDGSGKSTQVALLAERLKKEGIRLYTTMEPTNAPIGAMIRQIMTGRIQMDPKVIAALFAADRLDHLLNDVDGILAKIEDGITVVTDRYYFSSYAYHSVDMPMDWVIETNAQSRELLQPAATIFIDIDPDLALERIAKNRFHQELFEEKSRLVQVRDNYEKAFVACKDSENVIRINGNQSTEAIAKQIWEKVAPYFQ